MNINRMLGIFISVTILMWVLVFALSPQPKYQSIININIPDLPEPDVNQENFKNIKFKEVKNDSLEVDVKDTLPSAKERTDKVDLNFYVYRVGAFGDQTTISRLVKSYNNLGFPAFTEQNQLNKDLTNILVGPFASKIDIENNKQKFNNIADINAGEVIAWTP